MTFDQLTTKQLKQIMLGMGITGKDIGHTIGYGKTGKQAVSNCINRQRRYPKIVAHFNEVILPNYRQAVAAKHPDIDPFVYLPLDL